MPRFVTLAAAVVAPVLALAATPAGAQTAGYYAAVPAAPAAKTKFITRSTAWELRGDAFVANRAPERDMILCQLVAQRAGALASFSAGGKAFDAEALAKCNGRVKGAGATETVAK